MKAKSGTYRIGIRKTNRALVKSSYVKTKKTNEQTTPIPICPKMSIPKKTSIGFFLINFYIELFGVFVRKFSFESGFKLSFSSQKTR